MKTFVNLIAMITLTVALAGCGAGAGLDEPGSGTPLFPGLPSPPVDNPLTLPLVEPSRSIDNAHQGTWDTQGLVVGQFAATEVAEVPTVMNNWHLILSFDISEIPEGATIEIAELNIYQRTVTGDPYGKLGNLIVDWIRGVSYEGSLPGPGIGSNVGTLSTDADQEFKTLGIAGIVQQDLDAGLDQVQLRLRFEQDTTEIPGPTDHVNTAAFDDAGSSFEPIVKVQWRIN